MGTQHRLAALEGSQSSPNPTHFIPRSYQVEVFEVAKRKNTIAVLETGAGKTMIAVMLIKHIAENIIIKSNDRKKLIVFLAPTVNLVTQQCKVIKDSTTFEVGEYYGAKGVDEWNRSCWEIEANTHDILVMTPQILLDALRNAFLSLEIVCLVIFDECHRSTGNHPYNKIMKEFYHKSWTRPKIFGMTASPVIRKGVSSAMDCEAQISALESILDAQVYTIEDRTEIEAYVPSAIQTCRFYEQPWLPSLDLKAKMEVLRIKLQRQVPTQYQDIDDKIKMVQKRLCNDYMKILYCLDDLGLVCANEAAKVCLENVSDVTEEYQFYRGNSLQLRHFLDDVLGVIDECLPSDFEFDYIKAHNLGYISPKLYELLQIFESFGSDSQVLCLIFIERIITAKVIERYVKKVPCLSHFAVSYLTGSNPSVDAVAPKLQKEILESFRSGKVNLLFATDVVEEGIHVPNCSCVIRFDLPKTVRSYVQSRGRGRKNDSQFILMLERGNKKQLDQIFGILRSEQAMTDISRNRDPKERVLKACNFEETKSYHVKATGASVTVDSSVSLIHRYCEKLPGDRYFIPKPTFEFKTSGGLYECSITLPPNAAFQTTVGPMSRNTHSSKQLGCLEACKMLHEMGALDDHLLPVVEKPSENDLIVKQKESSAGAGTTKRKELHGTACIRALCGTWGERLSDGEIFEAYKFEFTCSIIDETYSGFVLLIGSKLDDDVGNIEMDLQLISRMVKSSVSSCGKMYLCEKQISQAKCFQEFFFNGLFGRLFSGSESEGTKREFLLQREAKSLWSSSNIYFLLPIETLDTSDTDSWRVNWRGISSCANVVDFLKKKYSLGNEHFICDQVDIPLSTAGPSMTERNAVNTIHFANCSVDVDTLQGMLVFATHTGRMYSIVEVVRSKSAESPFNENVVSGSLDCNYAEYFKTKYGIVLVYRGQPLLRLKQSHNPHNLLGAEDAASEDGGFKIKPQAHVYMPPEVLVFIDFQVDIVRSCYLLPSLMHRLESLMLASQLRWEINGSSSKLDISSSLILEALTTLRCCENFSLERLELLGDSVLKYAVSSHLFLKYPEKHEGQLTARRTRVICNSNLHKLGTDKKIQGYIRDSAFEPRRWAAPGQLSRFPDPCKCGVDTKQVPLDTKFQTEALVKVGKLCDEGHRWMNSKTIADCVEALMGAYYVGGGLAAALHVMKWLGIESEFDASLAIDAISRASLRSYYPKENEIDALEMKLGYEFSTKGLLQEAITHASQQKLGASYCYQRLEFLGDSVLDVLITQHLYHNHTAIDPGQLTDLRSAAVSNENFAQAAVRHNLHPHLQHCSGLLLSHIAEYEKMVSKALNTASVLGDLKGPKVLGDMMESVAGAILIDTKLDLYEVWRVFEPLLSPIVTPSSIQLHPLRKLHELCDSLGYFLKETCSKEGLLVKVELNLQLGDDVLVGNGHERSRKSAKQRAARQLLKEFEDYLKREEVSYVGFDCKRRKIDGDNVDDLSSKVMDFNTCSQLTDDHSPNPVQVQSPADSAATNPIPDLPVIDSINTKKGEPRKQLYELCQKLQWRRPKFTPTEHKSRTPLEFGEGSEKRLGFSSFVSEINLQIPSYGTVVCIGEARADKNSSFDSAVVAMFFELQRRGKITIGCS